MAVLVALKVPCFGVGESTLHFDMLGLCHEFYGCTPAAVRSVIAGTADGQVTVVFSFF